MPAYQGTVCSKLIKEQIAVKLLTISAMKELDTCVARVSRKTNF